MRASHDHQRTAGRRARVGPVLAAGSAPHSVVDHESQMGRMTRRRNSSMRGHLHSTAPTCRGLHCATAFSIQFAGATLHRQGGSMFPSLRRPATQFTHAARGGRIGELRYAARLSAKFSRRLTESRAHQLRIGHEPGSNGTDPLHLERLSSGFVAMLNHRTSGVVNVGKEVVGERNAE